MNSPPASSSASPQENRTRTIDAVLKAQPAHYRNAVNDYEQLYLIVVLDGVLHFHDDRGAVPANPGRMVVLRPGTSFTLHTESAGYSGVALELKPPETDAHATHSTVLEPSTRIRTLADWLQDELSLPRTGSAEIIAHLTALLAEIALRETRSLPPGEPRLARATNWARRAREAIENSIYTTQGVHDVLQPFPISYRQLARYLVAEFGATPKELQLSARIREARRLLRETSWSVSTIALELGFSSTQHFTASFRGREGVAPGQWRSADGRG